MSQLLAWVKRFLRQQDQEIPLLLAAAAVMSLIVVLANRLVWRPYRLAQGKYQLLS